LAKAIRVLEHLGSGLGSLEEEEPEELEGLLVKPGPETGAVETKIESKPIEPKPIEPKRIELKPIEPKPIELKPIDPQPIEPKPVVMRVEFAPEELEELLRLLGLLGKPEPEAGAIEPKPMEPIKAAP